MGHATAVAYVNNKKRIRNYASQREADLILTAHYSPVHGPQSKNVRLLFIAISVWIRGLISPPVGVPSPLPKVDNARYASSGIQIQQQTEHVCY